MTSPQEQLLNSSEQSLRAQAKTLAAGSVFDRAFYQWLFESGRSDVPWLAQAASEVTQMTEGKLAKNYRQVSALGIAVALGKAQAEQKILFQTGIEWGIGASQDFDGLPVGLSADPAAILAVAFGVFALGDLQLSARLSDWISLLRSRFSDRFDPWGRALLCEANRRLSDSAVSVTSLEQQTLIVALRDLEPLTEDSAKCVVRCCLESATGVDPTIASLLVRAFQRVRSEISATISLKVATLPELGTLLRGLTRGLQEWTWENSPRAKGAEPRKWHVDHEYHVQNLLWNVLAPIFPDLRREEFGPQIGGLQPRVDLAIPSLRVVVEVKFARPTDKLKDLIGQIAEDASLYFAKGSNYSYLIPFIWDDAQRVEEHETIVRGLLQLDRVVDAVVVSRPGKMILTPPTGAGGKKQKSSRG